MGVGCPVRFKMTSSLVFGEVDRRGGEGTYEFLEDDFPA